MYHYFLTTASLHPYVLYQLYNIPYKEGEPLLSRAKDNYQIVFKILQLAIHIEYLGMDFILMTRSARVMNSIVILKIDLETSIQLTSWNLQQHTHSTSEFWKQGVWYRNTHSRESDYWIRWKGRYWDSIVFWY
jgi:hypothetical protein